MIHVVSSGPVFHTPYLTRQIVPVTLVNGFPYTILVSQIGGYFHVPGIDLNQSMQSYAVDMHDRELPPSGQKEAYLSVVPDLLLPSSTVQLGVRLYYQRYEAARLAGREGPLDLPAGCIVVQEHASTGKQVFISHKDPENRHLARLLQQYLRHVGIKGYMAKDDLEFGTSIWKEKLPLAIRNSQALAAIWTAHTARKPQNIQREIDFAEEFGVPVMLVSESDIPPPEGYDPDIEYALLKPAEPEQALAELAQGLHRRLATL